MAIAAVMTISGHIPGQVWSPGPILPASATHHSVKKRTAAAGAPQCRKTFRSGSMPVTLSTAAGTSRSHTAALNL